jgi:LacI family transcriptional regulator
MNDETRHLPPAKERTMSEPRRVVLLVESSRGFGRNLLAGVTAYAREFGPWTFFHQERALGDSVPAAIHRWHPDGIIARLENLAFVRRLRQLKLPTVDLLHDEGLPGIPSVITNHETIVRLAIEHLLDCRLEHFAYCGLPGITYSEDRCRRFVQQLAAIGRRADVFQIPSLASVRSGRPTTTSGFVARPSRLRKASETPAPQLIFGRLHSLADVERDVLQHNDELAAWLRGLPKPVGLMACTDMRAYQVLIVCRECRISVPDEIAIIGVDNDPVQCELCDPPLSSVDNSAALVGYKAAALLDQLMQRRGAAPPMTLVEPAGVVARRSTDVLAVADREVVEVVRFVRSHACERITPAIVAKRIAMSRSTLERCFAKHLGRSVSEEIMRVRLARVKELLTSTDLSLAEIATRSGFAYSETMQRAFKSGVGKTPGQYRGGRDKGI